MGDITDWMHESGMLDMPDPFDHDDTEWGGRQPHRERGLRRTAYGPITQCKFCGSKDVYWQKTKDGHALHNRSDLSKHDCTPQPTADGFEDEPV